MKFEIGCVVKIKDDLLPNIRDQCNYCISTLLQEGHPNKFTVEAIDNEGSLLLKEVRERFRSNGLFYPSKWFEHLFSLEWAISESVSKLKEVKL